MIIDSHLHVRFSRSQHWRPVIEQTLHHMDMVGIEKTVIMPNTKYSGALFVTEEDMIFQAETLTEIIQAYPNRFIPLLFIGQLLPADFLQQVIEKYIVNGPLIGTKFHMSAFADDERVDPVYKFLAQHDITVLFHSWYKTVKGYTFESNPQHIAHLAKKHPTLRILMAHLTGCRIRGILDIKEFSNVWIDTSGSNPEDGYLQRAIAELGSERILYGSDYPGRGFSPQIARIESVEMSAEERANIMYRNAEQFFRKGVGQS